MEERVLYQTKTHPKILIKAFIIQVVLIAAHFLLFKFLPSSGEGLAKWGPWVLHFIILCFEIYYVIVPILQWYNNIFIVTNYRVKNDWGVIAKESKEIDIKNIVSIKTERSILDRIFGCGTLVFYGAASGDWQNSNHSNTRRTTETGVKFTDIPKVKKVEEAINKLRRR